jgi:hypothetical protein
MQRPLFILIFIIVVFVIGGLLYIYNPQPAEYKKPDQEQVVCTMDAKLCPDGSYVGRSGPNCEFICPEQPATSTKNIPPGAMFEDGTI